jgi:phosphohistidine phosphatase
LISPSARTRETWEMLAAAFPGAQTRYDDALYHADADAVRRLAELAGADAGVVMVVGHNPGLQDLVVRLLAEGGAAPALVARAQRRFPTAAAAVFLIDARGRPSYDGLFLPKAGGGE